MERSKDFICDHASYEKLKYIDFTEKEVNYKDEYEYGIIDDKIVM